MPSYPTTYEYSSEYLYLPLPITVGKTWFVPNFEADGKYGTKDKKYGTEYKVEAIETIELLDRKYENCAKISFQGVFLSDGIEMYTEGIIYKAPGIGDVRTIETVTGSRKVAIHRSLENYKQ